MLRRATASVKSGFGAPHNAVFVRLRTRCSRLLDRQARVSKMIERLVLLRFRSNQRIVRCCTHVVNLPSGSLAEHTIVGPRRERSPHQVGARPGWLRHQHHLPGHRTGESEVRHQRVQVRTCRVAGVLLPSHSCYRNERYRTVSSANCPNALAARLIRRK